MSTNLFLLKNKNLFDLDNIYEARHNLAQSDEKTFELYSQSAAQGHAGGQANLAICYKDGRGCKQSYERAINLCKQSAAQGNMAAQYNLAVSATCLT